MTLRKFLSAFIALAMTFSLCACKPINYAKDKVNSEKDMIEDYMSSSSEVSSSQNSSSEDIIESIEDSSADVQDYQPSADAMQSDFSHLSSLDSKLVPWGHGGPVDEKTNRPQSPEVFQKKYSDYHADFIREDNNKFYLTFDEGYENGYTAKILDVLKEKNAPAVFFVTYDYAKKNPDLIKRMIDEGHIVGNHSYSHPSMPTLPISEAADDVKKLHDYIQDEFGYTMNLFRFPKGEFSEQCLGMMDSMGYTSVFWSFAYMDWDPDKQPDPSTALNKLNENIHSGAIYLLHAVSSTNAQILGDFIDSVRQKGLTIAPYTE